MTQFFYSSPAGAIDFIALVFACACGFVFGAKHIKLIAATACIVFLYDRTILHMTDGMLLAFLASLGCLFSAAFVVSSCSLRVVRAFALLSVLKMLSYTALIAGVFEFETMATWATVVAYGQLFLILGGAADGNPGGRIYRGLGLAGSGLDRGWHNILGFVSDGRSISRHSDVPSSGCNSATPMGKESRKVAQ